MTNCTYNIKTIVTADKKNCHLSDTDLCTFSVLILLKHNMVMSLINEYFQRFNEYFTKQQKHKLFETIMLYYQPS